MEYLSFVSPRKEHLWCWRPAPTRYIPVTRASFGKSAHLKADAIVHTDISTQFCVCLPFAVILSTDTHFLFPNSYSLVCFSVAFHETIGRNQPWQTFYDGRFHSTHLIFHMHKQQLNQYLRNKCRTQHITLALESMCVIFGPPAWGVLLKYYSSTL